MAYVEPSSSSILSHQYLRPFSTRFLLGNHPSPSSSTPSSSILQPISGHSSPYFIPQPTPVSAAQITSLSLVPLSSSFLRTLPQELHLYLTTRTSAQEVDQLSDALASSSSDAASAASSAAAGAAAPALASAAVPASSPVDPKPAPGKQRGPKLFLAGGIAGAVARTCTAPLDRIKLLLQVQNLGQLGTKAGAYTGVVQAAVKIAKEEGILAFWKGNMLNVIRVFPYSAAQFASHEQYKLLLAGPRDKLTVPQRLAAGAMAGMTATALTHPLDTVRLRLAMPVSGYNGLTDAFITIVRKEGFGALYKGLFPTLLGIAPYAALNFASYDLLKNALYNSRGVKESVVNNLLIGAAAGTVATTVCYPLDTVRRRMQMKGKVYNSTLHAFSTMLRTEGLRGFYRGWWANTLKVVPQNSIRFVTYEFCKNLFGITKRKTDT